MKERDESIDIMPWDSDKEKELWNTRNNFNANQDLYCNALGKLRLTTWAVI